MNLNEYYQNVKFTSHHISTHSLILKVSDPWDLGEFKMEPFEFMLDDGSQHKSTPGHSTHVILPNGSIGSVPLWIVIALQLQIVIPR